MAPVPYRMLAKMSSGEMGNHLASDRRAPRRPIVLETAYLKDLPSNAGVASSSTDWHNSTSTSTRKSRTRFFSEAELVMIWGRQDPHIPGEGRAKVYQALTDAGLLFSWHGFNAEHAFMRDEGARYDAEVARTALGLALNLFGRTL
jgi:dienelactone hydrolase